MAFPLGGGHLLSAHTGSLPCSTQRRAADWKRGSRR